MQKPSTQRLTLILAALLGLPVPGLDAAPAEGGARESPAAADAWSFDVVPYLWLATYSGTFGVPGAPGGGSTPPSTSVSPYSTSLSAGAMLAAHIRYHDVGLFLDGAWVQLSTEGDAPPGLYSGTDIRTDIAYGTAALSLRLPRAGGLESDMLAGARTWYVAMDIEFKPGLAPGFTSGDSNTWCDPLVGARLRYDITENWFGSVEGDVGGFGVGSEICWNVSGGVGCRVADWCSLSLGYRYLHMDYEKKPFVWNADVQGLLLGVDFRF
jgi:opacity protein-like surface antigen